MYLIPVKLPWRLPDDGLLDFFIFQWRTPILEESGACKCIDAALVSERTTFLSKFKVWLISYLNQRPHRPLFIVTPELSLPFSCQAAVEELIKTVNRPVIFIAGFEFLNSTQYLELIASSDLSEKSKWTEGVRNGMNFNVAGIWLGDGQGNVFKFAQTKTSPSLPEHASVFNGSNLLFFMSNDQSNGRRLNFAVQLCSDFTSDDKVKTFRKCLGEATSPIVDITFLLQCNPNQDASQFRRGIESLFSPPADKMIDASSGCIMLVNNASELHGRSVEWGRCKVAVQFDQKWTAPLKSPQPTYYVKNQGDFGHQEIVFRESGKGIYRFTYKPRYLQRPRPGSRDEFPLETVDYAKIDGSFSGKPIFTLLHPTIHWLDCHWMEIHKNLIAGKNDPSINQALLGQLIKIYQQVYEEIMTDINSSELKARQLVSGYYICHLNTDGYPFTPPEPNEWTENVQASISKLLECYSLTLLGIGAKLKVSIDSVQHALFDETIVVFIFSRGKTVPGILQKFRSELASLKKASRDREYLLVLVDPDSQPLKRDIINEFESTEAPITSGISSLKSAPGEVVKPQPANKIHLLYSGELLGKRDLARDGVTLKNSLTQLIAEQFN